MVIYLCSCGFGTDDADWFDGHLFQHPDHYQRPMARYFPDQWINPAAVMLPVRT
jgi:hypothetical protein